MLVVLVLGFSYIVHAELSLGDPCFTPTFEYGTCVGIDKCRSLLRAILGGEPYNNCGWDGLLEIVCCSESNETSTTTSPRPTVSTDASPTTATTPLPPTTTTTATTTTTTTTTTTATTATTATTTSSTTTTTAATTAATTTTTTSSTTTNPSDAPILLTVRAGARVSQIKCTEYAQNVKIRMRVNSGRKTTYIETDRCGHNTTPLVVGGMNAKKKEFPHMALLGYSNGGELEWKCGGTLISDQFVLTAAHCISTPFGPLRKVRLGDHNKNEENRHRQEFEVSRTITHPKYVAQYQYYDVALVEFVRKVRFNAYMIPACLPTQFSGNEAKAIATGWGAIAFLGRISPILQKVTLDLFNDTECRQRFEMNPELPDGINFTQHICAGSLKGDKDTCQGDSGGPLQVYRTSEYCMYTVIGITSFGETCEGAGVFQRVYAYLDWIESIVWPN